MISPPTRLKCSLGHSWEPAEKSAAPLVCPTCGRPPTGAPVHDPDATVDQALEQDLDRTVDLPSPPRPGEANGAGRGSDRNEVTESMHFTPLPRVPGAGGTGASGPAPSTSRSGIMTPSSAAGPASMPFTILRQHARGGLGLVNLARDEHIKREVALKQILPQHADNGTLKRRFLYEAQITGQLEHPSIVPVYTLGSDDGGNPYYVMRFVKGRTLDEIIKEHHSAPNPIVFRELLRRFIAVCQAVAYAHSRGVIHRDLKPSNIMLGDYGETLVLDWGLAKDIRNKTDPALFVDEGPSVATGRSGASGKTVAPIGELSSAGKSVAGGKSLAPSVPSAELTMEGQIIGTPAYMAPEQAEGRTELHAPVTDIYALGGILYKILAGQSPTAPTASTSMPSGQRRLTFVPSAPPSKLNKDIDLGLERICIRAMAAEPAARYPRALELAQDIQRWLDEHPLSLKRETALSRVLTGLQRYGWAIAIVLLIGVLVLLWILISSPSQVNAASNARPSREPAPIKK